MDPASWASLRDCTAMVMVTIRLDIWRHAKALAAVKAVRNQVRLG